MHVPTALNYITSCSRVQFDDRAIGLIIICVAAISSLIYFFITCEEAKMKFGISSIFLAFSILFMVEIVSTFSTNLNRTGNILYCVDPREGTPSHISSETTQEKYNLQSDYTMDYITHNIKARNESTLMLADGKEITFNPDATYFRTGDKDELILFRYDYIPESNEALEAFEKGYEVLSYALEHGQCKTYKDKDSVMKYKTAQDYLDSKSGYSLAIVTVKA